MVRWVNFQCCTPKVKVTIRSEVKLLLKSGGWSGGALGKLPVLGRLTNWIEVGQGHSALAVGAGGGCLDIFSLVYHFTSFSLSLGDGPI